MEKKKAYAARFAHIVNRYKFALAAAGIGLLILLWPGGKKAVAEPALEAPAQEDVREDTAQTEKRLEALLALIDGVGEVRVMLTLRTEGEWVYADEKTISSEQGADSVRTQSKNEYVVVRDSLGNETLVPLRHGAVQYRGALVVCRGAGNATVRLALVEAVRAVTGLPSDCISVVKMG